MKYQYFLFTLLMAQLAISPTAVATTIDFADVPPEERQAPVIVSNGYVFSYDDTNAPGTNPIVDGDYGVCAACQGDTVFRISAESTQIFSLLALDYYGTSADAGFQFEATIAGYKNDGSQVFTYLRDLYPNEFNTHFFDVTWANLNYVEVTVFQYEGAFQAGMFFDNIVVSSVVPIPAAAWLFGSALAGLGWMRRKKTV